MRDRELLNMELEALYEQFGRGRRTISLREAARYCHKDARTLQADKTFPLKQQGKQYEVSILRLAGWLLS